MVEAATSAGSTSTQIVTKVQLPASRKSLMLAANQGLYNGFLAIVASALPNPTQVFAAGANVAFIKSPTGEAADIDSCLKPPSGGPTGLIGRIRLDRRSTLRERLGAASGASDADLLIGAYERWGADFLRQVRGDYCFVLVDSPRRRLIAARDQLGVRALFYARRGDLWLISDSLDWLEIGRAHV